MRIFGKGKCKGPSPVIDIFFQTNDVRLGGGGGSEPVRLGEKSALNFFLDLARGRAQQRWPGRAPAAPMRPEAETSGRGHWAAAVIHQFDLET